MWTFTPIGFFSATQTNQKYYELPKAQQTGHIMVRARVKQDLERLIDLHDKLGLEPKTPKIWELPGHDYPCRIVVPQENWVALAAELARSIDYSNFKNAVEDKAPTVEEGWARHDLYMKVWTVMHRADEWLDKRIKSFKSTKAKQQDFDFWNDPRTAYEMSRLEQHFATQTSTKKSKKGKGKKAK